MSADNVLATLQLKDGFRLADIHMIWMGEEAQLYSRYNKWAFAQSPHYSSEDEAEAAEDRICDEYFQHQRVLEYGCQTYQVDMTWAEYLAAGGPENALVECPVCSQPVGRLHDLTPGDDSIQVCQGCINGTSF